jgi:hypothetical protein
MPFKKPIKYKIENFISFLYFIGISFKKKKKNKTKKKQKKTLY